MATVVFRDDVGCWAFLDLWRIGGEPFDRSDAGFLRSVVPAVTAAARRSRRAFGTPAPPERLPAPLVLVLSPDLEVLRRTPGTEDALQLLVPRDDEGPPVPAGAYNVAAQLLAAEAGIDHAPPWARVHLTGNRWLTLRAARLDEDLPPASSDVAVIVEEASAAARLSLFSRCAWLSPRETELLGHLAAGADTRDVAARMFVSPYTVQDHLTSVFGKTGTRSRRALLARALGG